MASRKERKGAKGQKERHKGRRAEGEREKGSERGWEPGRRAARGQTKHAAGGWPGSRFRKGGGGSSRVRKGGGEKWSSKAWRLDTRCAFGLVRGRNRSAFRLAPAYGFVRRLWKSFPSVEVPHFQPRLGLAFA